MDHCGDYSSVMLAGMSLCKTTHLRRHQNAGLRYMSVEEGGGHGLDLAWASVGWRVQKAG